LRTKVAGCDFVFGVERLDDDAEPLGRIATLVARATAILAGQVQTGMTSEAVREALGEPRRIERAGPGEEMWTYDYVRVVLLNNRVTFVRPLS
jgi:hypothetical protein